ncbi:MAG: ABC transporter substrate-binding protein [Candidatus Rokuibacteriota bacterium]
MVGTTIARTSGRSMSPGYLMHRGGGRWLIYDVVLDGTSMVAGDRAQFARVIKTTSYEKLIEKLSTP